MLNKTRILALCVMAALFSVIAAQGQHFDTDWRDGSAERQMASSAVFEISWYTVDGGGGTSTGSGFVLSGTAGQPDAGDLAGGSGENWDTHKKHFPKMKKQLLPVFDRSVSALLTDLEQRGSLEETLVAVLTDFGRTPKINKNGGRDHHPAVYSLVLAGGGIQGGQVYGSSDTNGAQPATNPCTPADLHATVFKALGINHRTELHDTEGRPYKICDGQPLPLF